MYYRSKHRSKTVLSVKIISLNGRKTTGFIDTGSTNVLVRESVAAMTIGSAITNVSVEGVMAAEHFTEPSCAGLCAITDGRSAAGPFCDPNSISDFVVNLLALPEERDRLMALINNYRDMFAKRLTELECTNVLTMDIPEIPGSAPAGASRPYKTFNILQEWRNCGIVSSSTSSYASPVILANKT